MYGTSFSLTILGLIYIYFIPETVGTKKNLSRNNWYKKCTNSFLDGYRLDIYNPFLHIECQNTQYLMFLHIIIIKSIL